ncbi:MAG: hypothetical protein BA864_13255 [Desulfuromonadales bacterium C00003093]|nr:MAG: hypothetical protein BA864_13255 [Desulfuromonadales bacterium C00003093]
MSRWCNRHKLADRLRNCADMSVRKSLRMEPEWLKRGVLFLDGGSLTSLNAPRQDQDQRIKI